MRPDIHHWFSCLRVVPMRPESRASEEKEKKRENETGMLTPVRGLKMRRRPNHVLVVPTEWTLRALYLATDQESFEAPNSERMYRYDCFQGKLHRKTYRMNFCEKIAIARVSIASSTGFWPPRDVSTAAPWIFWTMISNTVDDPEYLTGAKRTPPNWSPSLTSKWIKS